MSTNNDQLEMFPVPVVEVYDEPYSFEDYQMDAVETLGPDRNPLALALGVVGEAGEVMEIILGANMMRRAASIGELVKKGNRPGREVDVEHLKEEIGDVLWYLAVLADYYDLDFEEIAIFNIEKLDERYNGKKA